MGCRIRVLDGKMCGGEVRDIDKGSRKKAEVWLGPVGE